MILHSKKLPIKFFIIQVIFVLSGYNYLYAYASQDCMPYCSVRILEKTDHFCFDVVKNRRTSFIKPGTSDSERESCESETVVDVLEEDELVSFKKHAESGNYVFILLDAPALRYFDYSVKEKSPTRSHSYNLSICKPYLLYKVFRL